jgi:hypothetical protein
MSTNARSSQPTGVWSARRRIPIVVLGALLAAVVCAVAGATAHTGRAHEIVASRSAANRAVARHEARRRLALFDALPGAVVRRHRPTGIGGRLRGQGPIPGDSRQVHEFRFLTVPGRPEHVYRWLRRHPPRGSAARENEGEFIYWEHGPPGTLGATAVVRTAPRGGGGTAVRVDIYESWELPRSPAALIPPRSRFVFLRISPSGDFQLGEKPRPTRRIGTTEPRLIASLARLVDRTPAFQLFRPPSCGPDPGRTHLFEFYFKTGRNGRTLARASQEAPSGLCASLRLAIGQGRHPFALEGGGKLLRRAHDLIRQAQPRPLTSSGLSKNLDGEFR